MPELPEVEITRRGIAPLIRGKTITDVIIRQSRLRWPIPTDLSDQLIGATWQAVERRAKYLLLSTQRGTLIIHLGMSGCLRVLGVDIPAKKHDHVDIVLNNEMIMRYHDPRRFGTLLWTTQSPAQHPLLRDLGVEPLSRQFTAKYLYTIAKVRQKATKSFIMDNRIVVGVGNIYATEALFASGLHPNRRAATLSLAECHQLVMNIKSILRAAIRQGGTTLKDFCGADGKPGYFSQTLQVYGQQGKLCPCCDAVIQAITIGQRTSAFCPSCQPITK